MRSPGDWDIPSTVPGIFFKSVSGQKKGGETSSLSHDSIKNKKMKQRSSDIAIRKVMDSQTVLIPPPTPPPSPPPPHGTPLEDCNYVPPRFPLACGTPSIVALMPHATPWSSNSTYNSQRSAYSGQGRFSRRSESGGGRVGRHTRGRGRARGKGRSRWGLSSQRGERGQARSSKYTTPLV